MEELLLFRGTSFEFYMIGEDESMLQKYLLAEVFIEEFIFQIICITGYYSGTVNGYVKTEMKVSKMRTAAITFDHLKNSLIFTFDNIDWESFKLYSG